MIAPHRRGRTSEKVRKVRPSLTHISKISANMSRTKQHGLKEEKAERKRKHQEEDGDDVSKKSKSQKSPRSTMTTQLRTSQW
tara:strand:+ start:9107 stop:9352 length:246 start_codon:yes stop_codon:yes gene_type:complete